MFRPMLGFLWLVSASFAAATDDPIKAELDKARASYAEQVGSAKKKLSAALEAKFKEVAAKGDLDGLKEIKLQKESFEKDGTAPTAASLARAKSDYDGGVRTAKMALQKALEKAKVEYTKALKIEDAEVVAAELKTLTSDLAAAKKDDAQTEDTLPKGTVWKGLRTFTEGPVAGQSVEFELRVSSRDGKKFTGYTTITSKNGGVHAHDIKGTVEDGQIEWTVVRQRAGTNPSQPHKGVIKDEKLLLTFEGVGGAGVKNKGTAELSLQKVEKKK